MSSVSFECSKWRERPGGGHDGIRTTAAKIEKVGGVASCDELSGHLEDVIVYWVLHHHQGHEVEAIYTRILVYLAAIWRQIVEEVGKLVKYGDQKSQ